MPRAVVYMDIHIGVKGCCMHLPVDEAALRLTLTRDRFQAREITRRGEDKLSLTITFQWLRVHLAADGGQRGPWPIQTLACQSQWIYFNDRIQAAFEIYFPDQTYEVGR